MGKKEQWPHINQQALYKGEPVNHEIRPTSKEIGREKGHFRSIAPALHVTPARYSLLGWRLHNITVIQPNKEIESQNDTVETVYIQFKETNTCILQSKIDAQKELFTHHLSHTC